MKKVKLFLYITLILSLLAPYRHLSSVGLQLPQSTPETNQQKATRLIKDFSVMYNVSEKEIFETVKYETAGTFDPCIQSKFFYKGVREESYGLAQINLPSHPTISKAEACDAVFAINFIASEFSENRQWEWSGWKLLKARGII